jgi:hypothetical protein
MPFNTEELIGRAKKNFEKFGSDYRWRREWRRQQRHWNRQWHQMSEQVRQATAQAAPQMGNTARAIMSIFLPIAAIVGALLFVGWILALFSLITQHNIFGFGRRTACRCGWASCAGPDLSHSRRSNDCQWPPGRGQSSGLGR